MGGIPRSKPRRLSAKQQRLFDEFLPMAEKKGKALACKYPGFDCEEVIQAAREGLWRACHSWEDRGFWEFEPYARQRIGWWVRKSLFVVAGTSAFRNARNNEVSGSEVVANSGKQVTLLEAADLKTGEAEFAEDVRLDHEGDLYGEILKAIDLAETLTTNERQALLLRYSEDLDNATVARRLRLHERDSEPLIRSGVRKLRAHFQSKGYETLPLTARLPNLGFPGRNA